jgi:hypothetical protein
LTPYSLDYRVNTSAVNDNSGRVTLTGAYGTPVGNPEFGIYEATSNSSGDFFITATVSDPVAGDNFIVEAADATATGEPGFAECVGTCPRSGEIQVWKRVYVEKHRMFRVGAYITGNVQKRDFQAKKNSPPESLLHVPVSNPSLFKSGDKVRLIHAPPIDSVDGAFASDDAIVKAVVGSEIVLSEATQTLSAEYGWDPTRIGNQKFADGIGKITGVNSADFFELDSRYLDATFGDAFVEIRNAAVSFAEVPYRSLTDNEDLLDLSRKWMQGRVPSSAYPDHPFYPVAAPKNYIFATGVGDFVGSYTTSCNPAYFNSENGKTVRISSWHLNASAVMVANIEKQAANSVVFSCPGGFKFVSPWYPLDLQKVIGEVLTHEIAHQFSVNPGTGHCIYGTNAYSTGLCRMNAQGTTWDEVTRLGSETGDDIVDFHYVSDTDSEYMTIRTERDPLP